MPEGLEAEIWRRSAQPLVGRTIRRIWVDERCAPPELDDDLRGAMVAAVERVGKVVLLVVDDDRRLGLHFGMTGRLVIDGHAPIERLEYASGADRPEWDRLRLWTDPPQAGRVPPDRAGSPPALRLNDPRRLGRISIDADLSDAGPDALTLTDDELVAALAGRRAAVKPLLLQAPVVAGLGNLCADEVLFHAGVAPSRPVDELSIEEIAAIATACRSVLPAMLDRGGSTHGLLDPGLRASAGPCPLDGHPLRRDRVGGRTAVWCTHHQT